MPELTFRIEGVSAMRNAAVPTLVARLRIYNSSATEHVHSILLTCQARIEPLRRTYTVEEEGRLLELFGERERWANTMQPIFWTQTVLNIPAFTATVEVDLPLLCTLDFEVAATKYFYGIQAGDIHVCVLFTGTVFYANWVGPGNPLSSACWHMAGCRRDALSQLHLAARAS
jgi:hypothetical protein